MNNKTLTRRKQSPSLKLSTSKKTVINFDKSSLASTTIPIRQSFINLSKTYDINPQLVMSMISTNKTASIMREFKQTSSLHFIDGKYRNQKRIKNSMNQTIKRTNNNENISSAFKLLKILQSTRQTQYKQNEEITLSRKAQIQFTKCQYNEALQTYHQLLQLKSKNNSPNQSIAETYHHIASIYYIQKDYTNTLSSYLKALSIQQTTSTLAVYDISTTYHNIAAVYKQLKQYDLALEYLNKSMLKVSHDILDFHSQNMQISDTYNLFSQIYYCKGQFNKALQYLEMCLKVRQQCLEQNDNKIQQTCYNMCQVYIGLNNKGKAKQYAEKCYRILKWNFGQMNEDTINARQLVNRIQDS